MLAAQVNMFPSWLGISGTSLNDSNTLLCLTIYIVATLVLHPIPATVASAVVPWVWYSCAVLWTFSVRTPSWMC